VVKPLLEKVALRESGFILEGGEAVRGLPAKLTLITQNLGSETFPGGQFEFFRIRWRTYGVSGEPLTDFSIEKEIPELKPKKSKRISITLLPLSDGLARIEVKLKAKDGKPIEYYQRPKVSIGKDRWLNFFYVMRREDLHTMLLLNRMYSQLLEISSLIRVSTSEGKRQ
jgi:hypothetical protein